MKKKGNNSSFFLSFCLTAIFVTIIIIATGIFAISLILNQNQAAIAQQQQLLLGSQQSSNQTISPAKQLQQQQPFVSKGISFDIDNVTFSHHMASVNGGVQIHYVIGGHGGDPVLTLDTGLLRSVQTF